MSDGVKNSEIYFTFFRKFSANLWRNFPLCGTDIRSNIALHLLASLLATPKYLQPCTIDSMHFCILWYSVTSQLLRLPLLAEMVIGLHDTYLSWLQCTGAACIRYVPITEIYFATLSLLFPKISGTNYPNFKFPKHLQPCTCYRTIVWIRFSAAMQHHQSIIRGF